MTRALAGNKPMRLLLLVIVLAIPQAAAGETPTKDERIEYHQLLEQVRQAQLASLAKQIAAQQQIAGGYQQAAEGMAALLASLQREGAATGAKSEALRQWRQHKPGRATCGVDSTGRLQCTPESEEPAAARDDPPPPPREAPAG